VDRLIRMDQVGSFFLSVFCLVLAVVAIPWDGSYSFIFLMASLLWGTHAASAGNLRNTAMMMEARVAALERQLNDRRTPPSA
jgi:hypothetical protein